MTALNYLLRTARPPSAAIEVAPDRVVGASVVVRSGRSVVNSYAVEPLPAGAVVPSLMQHNLHDAAALTRALSSVLENLGRPRRVGLVVPDPIAKVSVVHFDQAPAREEDLDRLIRFQIRKSAPFSIDDAQVSWTAGASRNAQRDYVVSIARREVVEEYEGACLAAGTQAGIVDLATFNVANAVLSGHAPVGDWLLVNANASYVSIAILRGSDLVFFRSRTADAEDTIADMVHQTAMYYEDRLQGGGFARVILCGGAGSGTDRIRQSLEARLDVAVQPIDARSAVTLSDRIDAPAALIDALAPVVGLLVRGRVAA